MQEQTSVSINDDGSIIIYGQSGGDIILHPGNEEEFAGKFRQLNDTQKNSLVQALIARKQELPQPLKKLLHSGPSQKNVIGGDISNVGSVAIGDKFDIHLHSSPPKLPAELTLHIPKIDPDKLIGRGNDLEELHELLKSEDGVVVNGLGGIGKTALAQAYVGKYSANYEHIAWITQTTDSIVDDVLNTKGLITTIGVDAAGMEPEQLFEKIILKLKSIEDGPNLLVIDNAEESLSGHRHLLPGQPDWHLLVTSREDLEDFYTKRLGFLSPEQAVKLFRQHYTLKGIKDEEISELAEAVDYHTLTIEILAKTAKVQRYSSAKLKQAIEQDLRANVKVGRQTGQVEKIGSYLGTVFNLSELEAAELWLMKQFACLPAEFHPYELVRELTVTDESPYNELFAETVSCLAQKGWLLCNQETDSYKMHRIIAEVVKKQHGIGVHDAVPLIEAVSWKLSLDTVKDNPIERFFWIPFGKALLDKFQDDPSEKVGVLLNNLALVLNAMGDYKTAKGLLEKVVQSNEKNFGPEHSATAISYSNLGTVLENLGEYEEAKKLLEKAAQSDEKNFGADHSRTAIRYSNLALILQNMGDYKAAKGLLEKAVQSNERNFGPDHPSTTVSYSNLAIVLQGLGDYEGAKLLLEKAISFDEKSLGPDHPGTATRYSNLGTVLQNLEDYKGARVLLEKAAQSDEKNFGPEHPTTILRYSNLATVLMDLGEYEEAKVLLERAIESGTRSLGPDHPAVARGYSNLALVFQSLGDYQKAKELLEKAVQSQEKSVGPHHPSTAISYSNLALVLEDLEDYEGARLLLEKAVESDEKNFGPDHPSTAIRYSNLATVLRNLGDYERAKGLQEKAVQFAVRTLGPEHPTTVVRYFNLASILKGLEDYEGARALLEKVVQAEEKTPGPDHPNTAISYSTLATVLQNLGEYEEARRLLEKAVQSAEKNFGPDHPTTAVRYSNLATVLQTLGNYEEARALMEKAARSDEKNYGPDHSTTAVKYSNLALILNDLQEYEAALELSEKALSIFRSTLPEGHPHITTAAANCEFIKKASSEMSTRS